MNQKELPMTIRHLRIFLKVADCSSMSQAAQQLHFSQSTISQAIKELETHYDTLLFQRLSKRLFITSSGEKLKAYAQNAVDQFDILQLAMNEESNIEHIRLGATITCGCCILPQLLRDFEEKSPNVDITSFIFNTHIIEEKILNGELDIALVEGSIKSKDLIIHPIIEDYLVLAFSSTHPFCNKTVFQPTDLSGQDFVIREKGSGTRESFENYLNTHQVSIHPKVEAPFPEAIKHAIIYNNCLSVISKRLLEKEIQNGEISFLRPDTNEWNRHFSLVYHKDRELSKSLKLIFELLSSYQES